MSESEYSESLDAGQEDFGSQMQHIQQTNQAGEKQFGAVFAGTSSGDSSISSTSSDDSDEEFKEGGNEQVDTLELAKITNEVLSLPRGLCENSNIFREFFSVETWTELPSQLQNHLQQFLPRFDGVLPPHMAAVEQARTISMLFNGELKRFGESPLVALQRQLEEGNCRPDIIKLKENIKKSQRREQRFQLCERVSQVAKQLFLSRQRLLHKIYNSSPDFVIKPNHQNYQQPRHSQLYTDNKLSAIRARKRFYSEISTINTELGRAVGIRDGDAAALVLSADEEDDKDDTMEELKKEALSLQRSFDNDTEPPKPATSAMDRCIYGTTFKKLKDYEDEDAFRLQQRARQSKLNNKNFKEYLREHKRRKVTEPTQPEFETSDIRLRDVCARAQMGGNFKKFVATTKTMGRKPKAANNQTVTATITSSMATTVPTVVPQPVATAQPLKLTEPPALVPIQSMIKKSDLFYHTSGKTVSTTAVAPNALRNEHQQFMHQQQKPAMELSKISPANESFNIPTLINVSHGSMVVDNIHLNIDDSSLLSADHDTFHMLDNEVDLQQEEVETFGTCEETLPSFMVEQSHKNDMTAVVNKNSFPPPQQQLPKLEPISRPPLKTGKLNVQSSYVAAAGPPPSATELIQETHACYFSLIRDFFCSTANHRMRYDDLRSKIDIWLRNPITALNEWYSQAANWSLLLKSAINFLVGEFPDLPDEYVPYIEYKNQINIYQWIGAGRDSDARLLSLCTNWMEKCRRPNTLKMQSTEIKLDVGKATIIEAEDCVSPAADVQGSLTPIPAPRFPTNWCVRPATQEEIFEYQRQEHARFEQPHRAYTYKMYGYESVVGPVKGIYAPMLALSKPRGHSMMVEDRPNFVTILTLVRDATARLPNGEGTRADISELLKCSQYINRDAAENVLQTIVSGALDRMHTEHDPCVRYDPKRKIWIYLHRNRTEADFEKIHHENQSNQNKAKKLPQRKPRLAISPAAKMVVGGMDNEKNISLSASLSESSNTSSAGSGTLLTLPALVPAHPVIVSNLQRKQNPPQQQMVNKNPPVPPLKYNIPPTNLPSPNQQQKSLLKTQIRQPINQQPTTISLQPKQYSFQMPQAKQQTNSTTPIVVTTPQGLQTMHVSTSPNTAAQQQNVNPQTITANLAGKKVQLNKPIIITQQQQQQQTKLKSPQQQQQIIKQNQIIQLNKNQQQISQSSTQNLLIPMSMANSININIPREQKQEAAVSAAPTTSTPNALTNKPNIIRLVPTSGVKNLNTQIVPRQRVVTAASAVATQDRSQAPQMQQQQQQKATNIVSGIQLLSSNGNIVTVSGGGAAGNSNATAAGSIVKMSPQAFASLQQKQLQQQQQFLVKQSAASVQNNPAQMNASAATSSKVQRLVIGNTAIMAQPTQGKNVIVQQIPTSVSTTTNSNNNNNANITSGINTMNLTAQQQKILIQNLKQQQQQQSSGLQQNQIQFKTVQVVGSNNRNQIAQQQAMTGTNAKNVVIVPQNTSQQTNISTRIIKTSPQIKSDTNASTTAPTTQRVFTSSSGQIISLESLLQRQGGTFRIAGNPNKAATTQLQITGNIKQKPPQQSNQQQQFAIVSMPSNVISISNSPTASVGQKIIATQAGNANVTTTSRIMNATAAPVGTRIIKTIPAGTKILTQQPISSAAASPITSNSTIRVINAVGQGSGSINLANLQGKQVILSSGKIINKTQIKTVQPQQQQQQQKSLAQSIVIGGQTVRLQQGNVRNIQQLINKTGNTTVTQATSSSPNIQNISASPASSSTATTNSQLQTIIMGNQILRVQPQIMQNMGGNSKSTAATSSTAKTIFVGSSGQIIRLQGGQQPVSSQTTTVINKNIVVNSQQAGIK